MVGSGRADANDRDFPPSSSLAQCSHHSRSQSAVARREAGASIVHGLSVKYSPGSSSDGSRRLNDVKVANPVLNMKTNVGL